MAGTEIEINDRIKNDLVILEQRIKDAHAAKKYISQQLAYGTKRVYQSDLRIPFNSISDSGVIRLGIP